MVNGDISYEDTVDPAGCNCGPEGFQICSRDPERTPMQWSAEKNAGFSQGDKTWLPVNPNYVDLNVEAQMSSEESSLKVYQTLAKLRAEDKRLQIGLMEIATVGSFLGIARLDEDALDAETFEALFLVVNFGAEPATENMNEFGLDAEAKVIVRSSSSNNPSTVPGNPIDLTQVTLEPYEAIVIDATLTEPTQKMKLRP